MCFPYLSCPEVVLEWKADSRLDLCLHSHHVDHDYSLRIIYVFPGPYVKSEESQGLDTTPLALRAFRERKPDRNRYHRTAPTSQEVGEEVWETKPERSAEPRGGNNR